MSDQFSGDDAYRDRVVGFVDILGFADLVRRADRDPALRNGIVDALRQVGRTAAPGEHETDLKAQNFSDSLIISAIDTPDGLWHLLLSIDALAFNLLQLGILVRGGVTIGGMRHDPDLVFGLGVNEAYRLESTVAKGPRIVLGGRAFAAARTYAGQDEIWESYLRSRLIRDRDGVWFLNYLTELGIFNRHSSGTADGPSHPFCETGRSIRTIIQGKVDDTLDQPDVYAKVEWLARFWNAEVADVSNHDVEPLIGSVQLAGTATRGSPLPFRGA